jgi:transposase
LIAPLDVQRFKFIDESGVNMAMTRLYGRAPRGTRVIDSVPYNDGPHLTMVGALGLHGLEAVMTVEGATDADVFLAYVEHVRAPTLRPGDIVVMDNLRAHKVTGGQPMIEGRGARLLSLPPYSPDRSPIEPAWSTLKPSLRTAKARTREALEAAITQALSRITAADAHGWFSYCGYTLQ